MKKATTIFRQKKILYSLSLKALCSIFVLILLSNSSFGQTASQVLESGIKVNSQDKIFLQYDNKVFKYALSRSLNDASAPVGFLPIGDSTIFLIQKSGINVFIRPLNPLNFSFGKETIQIVDEINQAVSKAYIGYFEVLSQATKAPQAKDAKIGKNKNFFNKEVKIGKLVESPLWDTCANFKVIESNLKELQKLLTIDKKAEINSLFGKLKSISFNDQKTTFKEIEKANEVREPIKEHFKIISTLIETLTIAIDKYGCEGTNSYLTKNLFGLILKDLSLSAAEQQKRLDNLNKAFKMVEDIALEAEIGGEVDGLRWCIKLEDLAIHNDKISILKLKVKESGLKLSDKNEIENIESKDILKTEIMLRKFQLFVPEISIGTAFTFFKYKTYGTTSDATGQQYVAEAQENSIKNINITTMVNWNLFVPNSQIHPLLQIGAGINEGIPTLMAGAGLRFGSSSSNRIRLTGGIAMTWMKTLDKLKIGDKITGTSDIENDLVYQFSWPPKPYIGLQYNF